MARSRTRPFARNRPAAFTLLELVMVLAIVGILAAIAGPRYINAVHNYRVSSAAQRVRNDLMYAQARARSRSTSRIVTVSTALDEYGISGETGLNGGAQYLVNLAAEPYLTNVFSIDLGGDAQVVFDGFGQPDADGVIVVRSGSRRLAINIDAATGEVTVEEITPSFETELISKGLSVAVE